MIPYPAYKSTNLPWLPKIPEHWEQHRLYAIACEHYISNKNIHHQNLLSLSYGKIVRKDINTTDGLLPSSFDGYQIVESGNVVLRLTDLQNDHKSLRVGFVPEEGIITSAYLCLAPRNNIIPKYLYLILHVNDIHKVFYGMGGGLRQSLGFDELRKLSVFIPPIAEQEQIVRYLDSMTAKINRLIRAKKKQIALLQEQRQAIINQAVTKGLAPNVEMKDSGQPRIGAIPRHWLLKEVKRMCRLQGGSGFPVEYQGNFSECIPFIKVNSLSSHISTTRQYDTVSIETSKLLNAKIFSQGDIVFAKVGAALLLHRFEILPFDCCIDNNMMAMYNISENVYWLKYALSLLDFNDLVNPGAVPSISQTQVGSLLIPCPPKSEQMEIVSHIEKHSSKINSLISRIEHSIDCLQEYKNSLISSVVTGQADVRNLPVEDVIPDDLIPDDDPTSEIEEEPTNDKSED